MKMLNGLALLLIIPIFIVHACLAQESGSVSGPKNETEKLVTSKIRELPEVKEWFIKMRKSKPGLIFNQPTAPSEDYGVQIGLRNMDRFRTDYWLFVNPKTYQIYFRDDLDTAYGLITLQQWRYWRTKPGWQKPHYYKGKTLVTVKN